MNRLLIVSNRLPINIVKRENQLFFKPSAGGVSKGLDTYSKSVKSIWIGWPGIVSENIKDKKKSIVKNLRSKNFHPVFLSKGEVEKFYYGFCNKTVWPLFHYFPQYTTYDDKLWEGYKKVNEHYRDTIIDLIAPGDNIWINDYQLMLLPKLIREKIPEATIGFFLHIPFPSFEIFRLLPWRKEILQGLLGADLAGFHTYDYVRNYLNSVHRLFGYESALGQITMDDRIIKADAFPMGIDFDEFSSAILKSEIQRESEKIRRRIGERKIILSVDRLDYTKGIPQRLEAFNLFLDNNPNYKEKVTLILVAVPSRTGVSEYRILKKQLDELVGRINGKHGTIGWTPIWYINRFLPYERLVALYNIADIALLTPLRDGMNLISKEFIATKSDSKAVLILSEMAGASKDLGEAIIVNPNNRVEVAEAIEKALSMSDEEQIERLKTMQERLQHYNVNRWANDFMDNLSNQRRIQKKFLSRYLDSERKFKLIEDYKKSSNRLLFLSSDGSLIPFKEKPEKAIPNQEILNLIEKIANQPKNEVVIISGRDRKWLEKWFGDKNVNLVAEHGIWIKYKNEKWEIIEPLKNDWKQQIKPLLELYKDRTPGALIEEKDFSLVWHYRQADPELASVRSRELKDLLFHMTSHTPHRIGVFEGNKIIEIKSIDINKGRAVAKWISKKKWDFMIAIGDDLTDEDLFNETPPFCYSLKVGNAPSKAKFYTESPRSIKSLLQELA